MLRPLLKTIPTLSGNIKLACDLSDFNKLDTHDYECYVRYAKLLPISSELAHKQITVNLLNSSYEHDIKKFYVYYQDVFFKSLFNVDKNNYQKIDYTKEPKYKDNDFDFGCKRLSYLKYNKQFAFFAPIYVESIEDIPDYFLLKFEIDTGSYKVTKNLKVNINTNSTNKSNYLYRYISKYLNKIDDNVLFGLPKTNQVTYMGIDVVNGGFAKKIDSLPNKIFKLQHTINNFDSNLTKGFSRNKMVMKQILPLAFYFNIDDMFNENERYLYINKQINISGYWYKDDIKLSFYNFSDDYTEFYQYYIGANPKTVAIEHLPGKGNIMDCPYPALNESKYINYKYTNKINKTYTRWKLKYSSDEYPYIINMNYAFSYNQHNTFKYGEYPTLINPLTGIAVVKTTGTIPETITTEAPTEAATQVPTAAPTEAPTETPTFNIVLSKNIDEAGTIEGEGNYKLNASCTVKVTNINSNYNFIGWQVNGYDGVTVNPYIFTVTKDVNIKAIFELKDISTPIEDENIYEQTNSEIWYTTTDNNKLTLNRSMSNVKSHTYNIGMGILSFYNTLTTIAESQFYSCIKLKTITIPNTVTSLGEYCFSYCKNLEIIKLSEGLANINIGAFKFCYKLKSVVIPEGVTTIKAAAFSGCTLLNNITLPVSLINIEQAFIDCSSLKVIKYNGTTKQFNNIHGTSNLGNVTVICTNGTIKVTPKESNLWSTDKISIYGINIEDTPLSMDYNFIIPWGKSNEIEPYKSNISIYNKYHGILNSHTTTWYETINELDDIYNITWADVKDNKAYFNGILYDLNNIYNKLDFNTISKIDKFAVFVKLNPTIISKKNIQDYVYSNYVIFREGGKYIKGSSLNCTISEDVLKDNSLYIKENTNSKLQTDAIVTNKVFKYVGNKAKGDFIDPKAYGLPYYDIDYYVKIADIKLYNNMVRKSDSPYFGAKYINKLSNLIGKDKILYKIIEGGYELFPINGFTQLLRYGKAEYPTVVSNVSPYDYWFIIDNVHKNKDNEYSEWVLKSLYFSEEKEGVIYNKTKYSANYINSLIEYYAENDQDTDNVLMHVTTDFISVETFKKILEIYSTANQIDIDNELKILDYIPKYQYYPIYSNKNIKSSNVFIKTDYGVGDFTQYDSNNIYEDKDYIYIDTYNLNNVTNIKDISLTPIKLFGKILNTIYIKSFLNEMGGSLSDIYIRQNLLINTGTTIYTKSRYIPITKYVNSKDDFYKLIYQVNTKDIISKGNGYANNYYCVKWKFNIDIDNEIKHLIEQDWDIEFDSFELYIYKDFYKVNEDLYKALNLGENTQYIDTYLYRKYKNEDINSTISIKYKYIQDNILNDNWINHNNDITINDEIYTSTENVLMPLFNEVKKQHMVNTVIYQDYSLCNITKDNNNGYKYCANDIEVLIDISDKYIASKDLNDDEIYYINGTYYCSYDYKAENPDTTYTVLSTYQLIEDTYSYVGLNPEEYINMDAIGIYDSTYMNTFTQYHSITYSYNCAYKYVDDEGNIQVGYTTEYKSEFVPQTYGCFIINLNLTNTGTGIQCKNYAGEDVKFIRYINGEDITDTTNNIGEETFVNMIKYIMPFCKEQLFNTFRNATDTIIVPNNYNIECHYMPVKYNNIYDDIYDIAFTSKLINRIYLQRYFDAMQPYLMETNTIKNEHLVKYKNYTGSTILDTTDIVLDKIDANIFNYYPVHIYDYDGNIINKWTPLEHKYYNDNVFYNLSPEITIHAHDNITYEELVKYENSNESLMLFNKYINNNSDKLDNDEILFLYNKYEIKYDSIQTGLALDLVTPVYTLTYKYILL